MTFVPGRVGGVSIGFNDRASMVLLTRRSAGMKPEGKMQ